MISPATEGEATVYGLENFKMSEMIEVGRQLRSLGDEADCMEASAERIVGYLYNALADSATGVRDCALVRLYKTHEYGTLEPAQQAFASGLLDEPPPSADMKCLTLLASIGDEPGWCARQTSAGHQAIPLPSRQFVESIPMIARLIQQLGMKIEDVIDPDPKFLLDSDQHAYNVFFVPDVLDSPHVPAQDDFVVPYHIKSAIGFGGMLPTGNLFVVILFTRVPVNEHTAQLFRTLSLNVKLSLLPWAGRTVFRPSVQR